VTEQRPLTLAPSRGFAVQRAAQAVDDSEMESTALPIDGGTPVVQGAWFSTSGGGGSTGSGTASAEASSTGSTLGTASAPHRAAETDMDELAGKLYDRIRNRLKTELLVDRERAGFLTDLR
jgi:hypothetical protein